MLADRLSGQDMEQVPEEDDQVEEPVSLSRLFRRLDMRKMGDTVDPVVDPVPKGKLVRCRITRNRRGIRGEGTGTVYIGWGNSSQKCLT